ncbi:RNase III domain-containing protein [Daldinia vernicosa]|uniref:RNase III domain-containing protein n=1 Tax=Daldinia vernicosa TaxID=114800 RepID=UPI002007CD41|nr:RNase III domain-containing protein [Daldinia vernicosa]KAI0848598.1 RNase III domain-containing protein [Daldinia vernicosa]
MASTTSRSTTRLARQAVRTCSNKSVTPSYRPAASFSTSTARLTQDVEQRPRWSYTPERMKAPFSPHITKDPSRSHWEVNKSPEKLDDALKRFLGPDGERMLPDELKWLAVTHKSFDQGRRGFNDRLAFLGRQICVFECTQSIINSPSSYKGTEDDPFADRREPFEDPALRGIDNLFETQPSDVFDLKKLAKLAIDTGLTEVVRWKPRMPENIKGSGFDPIMAGAIYAIVGAIALQRGGKIASQVVRKRIMNKLRP